LNRELLFVFLSDFFSSILSLRDFTFCSSKSNLALTILAILGIGLFKTSNKVTEPLERSPVSLSISRIETIL